MVAAVAAISSEAATTGVAHPQFGFLCSINIIAVIAIILVWGRLGEGAVIVYVVTIKGEESFFSLFGIKLRNILKKKNTYCPQLTATIPSSTRASLKCVFRPGAVTRSFQEPSIAFC